MSLIYTIVKVCESGYRKDTKVKGAEDEPSVENVIADRIKARRKKLIETGKATEEDFEEMDEEKVSKSDFMWIMTVVMKSDLSQPYDTLMNMNLTEIFSMLDKVKLMEEEREKEKGKGKRKGNRGKSVDLTKAKVPVFGKKDKRGDN